MKVYCNPFRTLLSTPCVQHCAPLFSTLQLNKFSSHYLCVAKIVFKSCWSSSDFNTCVFNHYAILFPSLSKSFKVITFCDHIMACQLVIEMQETHVWSLGQEEPLEEERATHSSILAWNLAWRIPWTEEPGGLQSMELKRVGSVWARTTI